MLFIILYWIYISLFLFVSGTFFERIIIRISLGKQAAIETPAVLKLLIGIAGLLIILSLVHFFYPINEFIHCLLLFLLSIEIVVNRKYYLVQTKNFFIWQKQISLILKLIIGFVILLFSYIASDLPLYNLDEGRYHLQNLLWSKSFSIVPGIANLHDRFASNSSWYLLNALFDVFYFSKKVYHIINSLCLLYLFLFCILMLKNFNKTSNVLSVFSLALLAYLICSFSFFKYWFMIGVTPDLGVHFFIISFFIYMVWLVCNENEIRMNLKFHSILALIICISAFLIRSTGVMLLMGYLPILILLVQRKQLSAVFFKLFLIGIFLFCIPVIRNFIMSGYPLYPSTAFDFFNVDWKFPKLFADKLSAFVVNHQLYEYLNLIKERKEYSGLFDFTRLHDLANMFYGYYIKSLGGHTPAFICLLVSPILFFNSQISPSEPARAGKQKSLIIYFVIIIAVYLFAAIVCGLVYRYGAGYICVFVVFVSGIIIYGAIKKMKEVGFKIFKYFILIILVICFLKFILLESTPVSLAKQKFNYPIALLKEVGQNLFVLEEVPVSPNKKIMVNNLPINVSEYIPIKNSRFVKWYSSPDTTCKTNAFIQYSTYSSCEELNATVATMNWMNDLPSVGGIYTFMEPRTGKIEDGFRVKK